MTNFSPSLDFAKKLDSQDPLASYRDQFLIHDPDLIYLDGNSLGMMPKVAQERAKQVVEEQWGHDLIRGCWAPANTQVLSPRIHHHFGIGANAFLPGPWVASSSVSSWPMAQE